MTLQATCSQCHTTFMVKIQQRLHEVGQLSIIEIGVECPVCGKWTHSCYMNRALEARANQLEELRDKVALMKSPDIIKSTQAHIAALTESYHESFERFQVKARKLLGVELPAVKVRLNGVHLSEEA